MSKRAAEQCMEKLKKELEKQGKPFTMVEA